ncbi:MAG: DUF4065 domain-containing protein [Sphingobacteriales bacterium]|nr:MAG: DUF4065 domain-containing protein [Sphingobacteriales bacterium]
MSFKTYPSIAIANYFIEKSLAEQTPLTPMKLQKLVYNAHGWYLALTHTNLIGEDVCAWSYGPVIPQLYHAFKGYGKSNITKSAQDFLMNVFTVNSQDQFSKDFLDKIWDTYKNLSAIQLSNDTHKEGSPWAQCYKPETKHVVIPSKIIESYFKGLANAN